MSRSVRSLLRSQDGSALVDSMVGVIITAIVVTSIAGLAVNITSNLRTTNIDTARSSSILSLVNDLGAQPDTVSTVPATSQRTLPDSQKSVTVWKTTPHAGVAVINAATSRSNNGPDDNCSDPATVASRGCLTASVSIDLTGTIAPTPTNIASTWSAGAVNGTSPVAVAAGPVGSFSGTGLTTVSYVVQVGSATGPGAITFNDGGTLLGTAPFDSLKNGSATGYLSGSITVNAASNVDVNLIGATASLSRFYIYKVVQ